MKSLGGGGGPVIDWRNVELGRGCTQPPAKQTNNLAGAVLSRRPSKQTTRLTRLGLRKSNFRSGQSRGARASHDTSRPTTWPAVTRSPSVHTVRTDRCDTRESGSSPDPTVPTGP